MPSLADRLDAVRGMLHEAGHPHAPRDPFWWAIRIRRIADIGAPEDVWDIAFTPTTVAMGGGMPDIWHLAEDGGRPCCLSHNDSNQCVIGRLIAAGNPIGALCWQAAVLVDPATGIGLGAMPRPMHGVIGMPDDGHWADAIAAVTTHAPPMPDDLPPWCLAPLARRPRDLLPVARAHPAWAAAMADAVAVHAHADDLLRWLAACAAMDRAA